MPVYEFRCNACHRRFSFLVRSISATLTLACSHCGSNDLTRLVSGFAFHRSIKTIHEESGEPQMFPADPGYYKDPRNIGRWAEKRLGQLGVDMPEQVQEMIAAAREGELPELARDL